MLRITKGDKVIVLTGKDRGKEGVVEKLFPKKGTAFVPGVGMYKKHIKPQMARDGKGGVFELFRPIALSKIALLDPKTGKATRVGFKTEKDSKVRVAKKSGQSVAQTTSK